MKFIGLRTVTAEAMTRLEYNRFRGWKLPSNENGADLGYKVLDTYSNHISWLPEADFNNLYNKLTFSFGIAIEHLKAGKKVARTGWNGKGMYLQYVAEDHYDLLDTKVDNIKRDVEWNLDPFILMFTAGGS